MFPRSKINLTLSSGNVGGSLVVGVCKNCLLRDKLRFFNQKWQEIGAKSPLGRMISHITGVPEAVLLVLPKKDMHEFPIAARISWIAKRKTTRIEDMSYSLLGILNVNMPMLYGEGQKAFLRLQEEIIRKYNDLLSSPGTEQREHQDSYPY
jgi:hypothetical protein